MPVFAPALSIARGSAPSLGGEPANGGDGVVGCEQDVGGEEMWLDAEGGVFARCRAEGAQYLMELPGLGTLRFDRGGASVIATPHPDVSPDAVTRVYRDSALPLVLQARGAEVLHASAVLAPSGVVAFCGVSGSGKSTIAYGLHRRGHRLWADDAVALDIAGATVTTERLRFAARLRPPTAALFGLGPGRARLDAPGGEPEGDRAPLVAVCLLERERDGDRDRMLTPVRPALAFPRVLAHAFCFRFGDSGRKRVMIERYLSLAARVPVFEISVPHGLDLLPALLDVIERAIGRGAGS